jgi:hypothetical protein
MLREIFCEMLHGQRCGYDLISLADFMGLAIADDLDYRHAYDINEVDAV